MQRPLPHRLYRGASGYLPPVLVPVEVPWPLHMLILGRRFRFLRSCPYNYIHRVGTESPTGLHRLIATPAPIAESLPVDFRYRPDGGLFHHLRY